MKTGDIDKDKRPPKKVKPPGADGHRRRMIDRLLNSNNYSVPPRDLVEILLFYTIRVRDTRDTAVYLMQEFDNDIEKLLSAAPEDLMRIKGVGRSSAEFFSLIGHTVKYINENDGKERKCYTDMRDVGELFSKQYQGNHRDAFWTAFFDNSMRLIAIKEIKDDKLSADDKDGIFPIIVHAAQYNCSSFAIARLSGDFACYPTANDFGLLKKLLDMSQLTNIILREYFIVSPDESIGIKDMYI